MKNDPEPEPDFDVEAGQHRGLQSVDRALMDLGYLGERIAATVEAEPLCDPGMMRLRG